MYILLFYSCVNLHAKFVHTAKISTKVTSLTFYTHPVHTAAELK